MSELSIGVDIGGGHIICGAVDMKEGLLLKGTISEEKVDNKGSKEEVLSCWAKALNKTLSKISLDRLIGIGFAIPGPFNYQTGVAMYELTDKYESLYNVSIKEAIMPYLDLGTTNIRFINDASAFAVGSDWMGKAKGSQRSVSITLGTGFGAAFLVDGLPVVTGNGVPDQGCLWHLPFQEGIADDYFSTRWFVKECLNQVGEQVHGVKEVAKAAKDNSIAKEIFNTFATNLATFLTPWFLDFRPDVLVLGGNVNKAADLFLPQLQKGLEEAGLSMRVEISALMEDAAMLGSARLTDDDYWNKISTKLPTL